ncbi:uncharacterized protein LOC112885244 [Panicum hallii]|uniref:uncharacterized protein LOC112885244 n=1 Tax=Panicum hallii TaxID=206008 RepID=UPI000DF4E8DB|nr:uncharacterized protein LOC112885244 [Panicum hallii]
MAAAGAPFSIRLLPCFSFRRCGGCREYAARARTEGGGWPFRGGAGALPPVKVRRFRWWEDVAAAAVEDEEGEVERRMAAKRRKRSVAELFAAVPRVARGQGCGKGKAAKRKLDGKGSGKDKVMLAVRVKASNGSKKKKKKAPPTGIDVREKEKSSGVKATSISVYQLFQHSIRKKKPKNSLSKKKGSQEVSVLLGRKSKKGNRKSVLERHKKDITNSIQAQSICKKQSKAGFSTVLDNTDIRCNSSSYKSKHVTFSDGTEVFRWTAHLPEVNTEQRQSVQTSQRSTREGHDHRNTDKPQLVCQQADAISGAVENTSSLSENVVSAGVHHAVPLTKPKDRTILGTSVDLNHCIETSNSSNCLNSISLACLSRKVPFQNFNGVNSHLDSDDGLSSDVECLGERNHMVSQASYAPASLTAKAISGDRSPESQPSSSCLREKSRSTLQERSVANYHLGTVHPELLRSGKDVMRSISSSIGSHKPAGGQGKDCVSAGRNMHFGDDYLGLPINSRGEFVKVHPGGTPNSVDIFKRQYMGESSLGPSAIPTVFTPSTGIDHDDLRPNHHARQIYSVDQSVFHADTRFTPAASTAYGLDFRQLPSSERAKIHYYRIPSNKYPCTNQQELSVECFCSGCIMHHNTQQRLHGMQSLWLSQNSGQNTQHNAETTMRLMGKTVTLGTSAIQCRDLDNETPRSSKKTRAEDQFFQGTRLNFFPQLFHGGAVDPPSACRISDGERQSTGNPSHFSFVPAAVPSFVLDTSSFRTNSYNQQPELVTANNRYARSGGWCNESEIGHRQPVMAKQVQSNAEDTLSGSMHRRHTQTLAPESSLNRRNDVRDFMEQRQVPSYLPQQFNRMTQRRPVSSFASSYPVQNATGLATRTKFTSLRPLPPSVIPSQACNADYAPPHGSITTFRPPVPVPYPVSNPRAPGNGIFEDQSMRWTMMGSNPEGLEDTRSKFKRPAEKDDVFLTLPKKPCTAAVKELNMLSFPGKGLEFRGYRTDSQARDAPICAGDDPEADLRLGNRELHATWSSPANAHRPLKLKPGAKHVVQPSAGGVYQESPWPVHPVTPLLAPEKDACTLGTSS